MKKIINYQCDYCKTLWNTENQALSCEKLGLPKETVPKRFTKIELTVMAGPNVSILSGVIIDKKIFCDQDHKKHVYVYTAQVMRGEESLICHVVQTPKGYISIDGIPVSERA
jgi:hypothetical protein